LWFRWRYLYQFGDLSGSLDVLTAAHATAKAQATPNNNRLIIVIMLFCGATAA